MLYPNMNTTLLIVGFVITICLYLFSEFFKARKMALLLFCFGWMVYIAGFVGTSIVEPMPVWAWVLWVVMVAGLVFGIIREFNLWQKSR
jgi:hypothetical protein